jgi:hypothetical protein
LPFITERGLRLKEEAERLPEGEISNDEEDRVIKLHHVIKYIYQK